MPIVIFVPGIMGSKLIQNEATKWPVLWGSKFQDLSIDRTPEVLDARPFLEMFKFHIVYKDIVETLQDKYGANFIDFWYDWRHSLWKDETFQRLLDFIEEKDSNQDIVFVAHSMGGLLVRMFVHWCETTKRHDIVERIKKVITVATPWRGAPDALWKLYYGEPFPDSVVRMTPADVYKDVASRLPSVYQLLPHASHVRDTDFVVDPNKGIAFKPNEIYDNMLTNFQHDRFKKYEVQFVHNTLSKPWPEHITTHAVIGYKKATVSKIILATKDQRGNILKKQTQKMSGGDLTVPIEYAQPHDSKTTCKYIEATHQGIVRNKAVLSYIPAIIDETKYDDSKNFSSTPSTAFEGCVIKVACPVEVSIYRDNQFIAGEATTLDELKNQLDWLYSLDDEADSVNIVEEVKVMGESTYIITSDQQSLDYKIEGKDDGIATIEIQRYQEGELKNISIFPALKVEEGQVATLHIENLNNVTLIPNNKDVEPISPEEIVVQEERVDVVPKTNVRYDVVDGKVLEFDNTIIIQSPITFNVEVTNITEGEFLETRIIANGKQSSFANQYTYYPEPGLNEIIIYAVSKYGKVDNDPYTLSFIYDCEAPVTNLLAVLFPQGLQIFLNAVDDSGAGIQTFYKFENEDEDEDDWKLYTDAGIRVGYGSPDLHYYSIDAVENKENPFRVFEIPACYVGERIFSNQYKNYNELLIGLGIEEDDVESIIKDKQPIKRYKTEIHKKADNIIITVKNQVRYSILFNEEFDVLWTQHAEEFLYLDDPVLMPFKFRLVTPSGFTQKDTVKVKAVFKPDKTSRRIENIRYLEETKEYQGFFGIPLIPRHISEGELHIIVNNKIYREAKFVVLDTKQT